MQRDEKMQFLNLKYIIRIFFIDISLAGGMILDTCSKDDTLILSLNLIESSGMKQEYESLSPTKFKKNQVFAALCKATN